MTGKIIPFVAALLIIISFFLLLHPDLLKPNMSNVLPKIQGGATQSSFSLGITVIKPDCESDNNIIPANGTFYPNISACNILENISGLSPGRLLNITINNTGVYPPDWAESPLASSVATSNRFAFMDIQVNASTSGGSYHIYFQISQASLGNVAPSNVRMFIYENGWSELSTTVVNASSDPAKFSATTTHFSKFIIGEKPSVSQSGSPGNSGTAGSSGNGGGGSSHGNAALINQKEELNSEFTVSPDLIEASLKPGEGSDQYILIENKEVEANFTMSIDGSLLKYVAIRDHSFVLTPGEQTLIKVHLYAPKDLRPGIYPGIITIMSSTEKNKFSESIGVILKVEDLTSLFDFSVAILSRYKVVAPNGVIVSSVNFKNIGSPEDSLDINYQLKIIDYAKTELQKTSQEIIGIKGEDSVVRDIILDPSIGVGKYILLGEMKYDNITLNSYDTFTVAEIAPPQSQIPGAFLFSGGLRNITLLILLSFAFLICAAGVVLLFIFLYRKYQKYQHQPHPRRRLAASKKDKKDKNDILNKPIQTQPVRAGLPAALEDKSPPSPSVEEELERGDVIPIDKLKEKLEGFRDAFFKK